MTLQIEPKHAHFNICKKNDYFEWYFGFTGFMRALLTSAIINRLAIKYMVEL